MNALSSNIYQLTHSVISKHHQLSVHGIYSKCGAMNLELATDNQCLGIELGTIDFYDGIWHAEVPEI